MMKQKLHDFFQMLTNITTPSNAKPATDKQRKARSINVLTDMLQDSVTYTERFNVAEIDVTYKGYNSKVMRKRTFIVHD